MYFLFILIVLVNGEKTPFCDKETDVCSGIRRHAQSFVRIYNESLAILCVEELTACIEVYYCINDQDCGCKGDGECIQGKCGLCNSRTLSINAVDSEERADPTTAYIIAAGLGIFFVLGILFTFVMLCQCRVSAKRVWF